MSLSYVLVRGKFGVLNGAILAQGSEVFNEMPGYKRWQNREILFELSAANIEFLQTRLAPNTIWSSEAKQLVAQIQQKRKEQEETIQEKQAAVLKDIDFPFVLPPFAHQHLAFQLSRDKYAFALLAEMGTGKTKILIDTAAYLFMTGQIDAVLVFAPNGVHNQWVKEEIPKHMPRCVTYSALDFKARSTKTLKQFDSLLKFNHGLRILSMNIECLQHDRLYQYVLTFLKAFPRNMVIMDESTDIKTPGSIRTKNALALRKYTLYRRIATGSPIPNGVEDFYSQFAFLDPDILGYQSYYTFRNHFCRMGGWENKKIVGYKNIDELQEKIEGWSFRIRKKDCLDLPESIYITLPFTMTAAQQKAYSDMKENFIYELENTEITAVNVISMLNKLQQITSGFIITKEGTAIDLMPLEENPKIKLVDKILKEVDSKIIIWAAFTKDIENLAEYFRRKNVKFVTYYSKTSSAEKEQAKHLIRNDPEYRVFIGNPKAAGVGLNLAVANEVIYYSYTPDSKDREQSKARTERIGMTGSCTYTDLYAVDTINEKILKALNAKKNLSDSIIDAKSFKEFLLET